VSRDRFWAGQAVWMDKSKSSELPDELYPKLNNEQIVRLAPERSRGQRVDAFD
jgi:hypothetical protein